MEHTVIQHASAHMQVDGWMWMSTTEYIYTHALRTSQMSHRCASMALTQILQFAKRLFHKKNTFLNQSIAVLRGSVGLLGQSVTVWKNRNGHANTPNYCNPTTHAHLGLMIVFIATHYHMNSHGGFYSIIDGHKWPCIWVGIYKLIPICHHTLGWLLLDPNY